MPEGPFGIPRLTQVGPLTDLTREEKIVRVLNSFSTDVTYTERGDHRFTFRIDLPSGSTLEFGEELGEMFTREQQIPSNLIVVRDTAEGSIRPPMISKEGVGRTEESIKRDLDQMVSSDVEVVLIQMPSEREFRPRITVLPTSLPEYMRTVSEIHLNYVETVLG